MEDLGTLGSRLLKLSKKFGPRPLAGLSIVVWSLEWPKLPRASDLATAVFKGKLEILTRNPAASQSPRNGCYFMRCYRNQRIEHAIVTAARVGQRAAIPNWTKDELRREQDK